uniref:Uncharacterized protein n=1 Tax=Phlebotomus papatasi TaxID=29031 RepID=A0A1B0DKV5_PHLPP
MAPTRNCPGKCGACRMNINGKFAPGLQCSGGCGWYHAACTDPPTSEEDLIAVKSGRRDWMCDGCAARDRGAGDATKILNSSGASLSMVAMDLREDVGLLRTRCAGLESENNALRGLIETLSSRISALEEKFCRLDGPGGPSHSSPVSGRVTAWSAAGRERSGEWREDSRIGGLGTSRKELPPGVAGGLSSVPDGGSQPSGGRSNSPAGPQTDRTRRFGRPRQRMVIGCARNDNPLPTVPSYRWLFVTRLSRGVTCDQIRDYMAGKLTSRRRPRCINLIPPGNTERRSGCPGYLASLVTGGGSARVRGLIVPKCTLLNADRYEVSDTPVTQITQKSFSAVYPADRIKKWVTEEDLDELDKLMGEDREESDYDDEEHSIDK